MGIMPHTDVDKALALALNLDIPFWPQLPKLSFYEDMYVQAAHSFPGIGIDPLGERIFFDTTRFEEDLISYSQRMDQPEMFALREEYSLTLRRFLEQELWQYVAIRGQLTGPVSLGFRIVDEHSKPIIYNEAVKSLLFDFIQRRVNLQYQQLREKNQNAFVWLDEPGLGWVFSGLTGYNDAQAKADYQDFLQGIQGTKALHLCANVNLPYLLELGIEILSFDAYQLETMPAGYARPAGEFLKQGRIISWGIVPTDAPSLEKETPETLAERLSGFWDKISQYAGIEARQIAEQALIAPARCCLKNIGQVGSLNDSPQQGVITRALTPIEERIVELAFSYVKKISLLLKDRYRLSPG
jgi:hypothetical protein